MPTTTTDNIAADYRRRRRRARALLCLGGAVVLLLAVCAAASAAADWDLHSDAWVATDALGRSLPGYGDCGPPRPGRYVGIFYFIWSNPADDGSGPYDITRIVAANPDDPKWGPVHAFHHWGESELGYYRSDDPYVIRKHIQMLADAGVDTLIIDVTNAFTYRDNYMLLFQTLREVRDKGGHTPQVCFIAHSYSDATVTRLYDDLYSKNLYPDLWFRWKGKPLILANPGKLSPEIRDFFTFRESWAWHDPNDWFKDGRDKWTWLDSYPQEPGWHEMGKPEEVSVCVAQHPVTNIGRSFHDGKQPDAAHLRTESGPCFAEQWKRALEVDPEFVFITGWNEWIAQRFINEGGTGLCGKKLAKGETFFVDAYNQEYSRDIEPMKGGHTDNYYYQMIDGIRRFKGVCKPEPPSPPRKIKIDGRFDEWTAVRPEFRDTIGDTERRSSKLWGSAGMAVNNTGRNDFVRAKVARDSKYIYFYVETKDPITSRSGSNWMLLFIDSDCNPATGWHGYDFLVNSQVVDGGVTTLKRSTGGWDWKEVRRIRYAVSDNKMELAIPRADLGKSGGNVALDFHWADNIQKPDDIIEFAVSGDSAPNRRFNYRYGSLPGK